MKPKIPPIVKPKTPQDPVENQSAQQQRAAAPKGANSLVSAGKLMKKATTQKASLLG